MMGPTVTTNGERARDLPIPSLDWPSDKNLNSTAPEEAPGDEDKRKYKLKVMLMVTSKWMLMLIRTVLSSWQEYYYHRLMSMVLTALTWSKFLNSLPLALKQS
jgi:hypothetical protein